MVAQFKIHSSKRFVAVAVAQRVANSASTSASLQFLVNIDTPLIVDENSIRRVDGDVKIQFISVRIELEVG